MRVNAVLKSDLEEFRSIFGTMSQIFLIDSMLDANNFDKNSGEFRYPKKALK
jgi:hypothetical protein